MRDEDKIQTASRSGGEEERFSHQREWIVKANGRILGPFTSDEVVQNIRDNRFVPHDEIIAPKGRWKLIRQEERFNDVVNESRNRGSSSATGSITVTENATAPIDLVEDSFRNTRRLMEGVENQVPKPTSEEAPSRDATKIYSYQNDKNVKNKFVKIERVKIFLALALFLAAGVFATIKGMQKNSGGSKTGDLYQEAMTQAQAFEKSGEFAKAISAYSEARNIKPNDFNVLFKTAPLILVHEKQILQASRMFKQIIENDHDETRKKGAVVGMGLVSLESHEIAQAAEYFSKALTQDPNHMPAIFNMGVVNYYQDKFEDAEVLMRKALEKGGNDGAVVLAMADVNVVTNKLEAAAAMMKAFLEVSHDYRPQVLIQSARVLTMLNRPNEATKAINSILELDPDYIESFERNWQVYRGSATWDRALENLKKAWGGINVTPQSQAVQGLIMYWGREKLDGAQMIEKALSQAPKDPQVMAIAGWVGLKLGRRDAALTNIKEAALLGGGFKLPKILMARVCIEDKDFECAQKNFEDVLKIDQKSLTSYLGLAQIALLKKDTAEAVKWLRQGQAMGAQFLPFAALNSEIEAIQAQEEKQ